MVWLINNSHLLDETLNCGPDSMILAVDGTSNTNLLTHFDVFCNYFNV